ncbi:ATP-binding protein [Fibrobacter sp. UWEL]|uniref:ATP-binding protein n=1 Tax=Fibrobacter sp. UWEL TaxID=1896209 RepID=UPI000913B01C|nr:ATP-binding protein [Fibrobacter sp. UWEL]SHL32180.1 Signal transduction histidine kinase [Fibrobacter sp. UWEL]
MSIIVIIVAVVLLLALAHLNVAMKKRSVASQVAMKNEAQRNFSIIKTLATTFDSVCYVDAKTKLVIPYSMGATLIEKLGDVKAQNLKLSYDQGANILLLAIVHPDDKEMVSKAAQFDNVISMLQTRKSFSVQCQAFEYGVYRYHRVYFIKSNDNEGVDGFVVALADIDDEIRKLEMYQQELKAAKKRAEDASQAKSDFLANMSHEIRTPINAVMGMNEMILRECKDPQVLSYAEDIKGASQMLLSIINDILDFSKIEAGKMEIVDVKYDISSVLNDVSNMIGIKAEQKGLKLKVSVDENIPSTLLGDSIRIQQIMLNLLNNSVKYTESGEVIFKVGVDRIENDIVYLKIEVQDSGIGIREEDLDKLFQSFQRLDLTQNRTVEGTGLGLAITGKLVDRMGGTINVASTYGKGSSFTVLLPQRIVTATPVGDFEKHYQEFKQKKEQTGLSFTAPGARVLVVDDNALNLRVATHLMKYLELKTFTCNSGNEFLELIQKEHFDLVFLDHMMPGMDGIEALKQSKMLTENKCAKTPIIALTANAIVGAKEMYLKAGFDDYLCKPIRPQDLENCLLKFLPRELIK